MKTFIKAYFCDTIYDNVMWLTEVEVLRAGGRDDHAVHRDMPFVRVPGKAPNGIWPGAFIDGRPVITGALKLTTANPGRWTAL